VSGKERIFILLFVLVILIGILVANPTLTSIYGYESTFLANHSSLKNIEEQETFKITDNLKKTIQSLVDDNKTNAAIVVGLVDPNGTQFYGYGNISILINIISYISNF
jgi:hypothetical protein